MTSNLQRRHQHLLKTGETIKAEKSEARKKETSNEEEEEAYEEAENDDPKYPKVGKTKERGDIGGTILLFLCTQEVKLAFIYFSKKSF